MAAPATEIAGERAPNVFDAIADLLMSSPPRRSRIVSRASQLLDLFFCTFVPNACRIARPMRNFVKCWCMTVPSTGFVRAAVSAASLDVLHGPPQFPETAWQGQPGSCFRYSPDGNTYIVCGSKSVLVCSSDDGTKNASFAVDTPVTMACFSPTGAASSHGTMLEVSRSTMA